MMQKRGKYQSSANDLFSLRQYRNDITWGDLRQLTGLGLSDGWGAPQAPRLQTFLKLKLTLPH
jgi:hypothetical protein